MTNIRKTNYFDKFRIKKMISYLNPSIIKHYTKIFRYFPFAHIHSYLPLCLKFLPESYVIEDKKDILGLIALSPAHANPFKQTISRLFLDNEDLQIGKQLIDFVVAKYGSKGAYLFLSIVDTDNEELLELFTKECGFRHCSSKELWLVPDIKFESENTSFIRPFKNSDAQNVVDLYNDCLITHFKASLKKQKDEYTDPPFKSLDYCLMLKYIIEDEISKKPKAFLSIMSNDNQNYILTITKSLWYDVSIDDILRFSTREVKKRNKNASLYVKVRRYTQQTDILENYLREQGASCSQAQAILVKDFYREVKETNTNKILLFNQIKNNTAFKVKTDV